MNLTERHIINKAHSIYSECDLICLKSKNIYNQSLYKVRQGFFINDFDPLNRLFHYMKIEDCFKDLPMKVATATIIQTQKNFKAFFKSMKAFSANPSKFLGKPKLPHYLDKENGRFITSYNYQAILSIVFKKEHKIKLSGTNICFYTRINDFKSIDCVRIIPRLDQYVIEVCYTVEDVKPIRDNNRYASIDLGLNNLAAVTSNTKELTPLILNGKPLKSVNQYYNKELAYYKSKLEIINKKNSKKTRKLTNKRNNKVYDYLHKASKIIVNKLLENKISKLVIGKNDNWKQNSDMSKKNNQNFIFIPHNTFINMLTYKCIKSGIRVILQEESYTSKASFLNLDNIPVYGDNKLKHFSGYRYSRGLYKIRGKKKYVNADVNGSYNILRKAIPKVFNDGIEGIVVYPTVIQP